MSTRHLEFLDTTVNETYGWLNDMEVLLEWDDHHRTLQALRGFLHALRDQLTVEQSAHLAAQLPTLLRGIYFESWKPSAAPVRDRRLEAFLDHMRPAITGYIGDSDLFEIARASFSILQTRVSIGEAEKLLDAMPKGIRELLQE